jgi:hypothetical protein
MDELKLRLRCRAAHSSLEQPAVHKTTRFEVSGFKASKQQCRGRKVENCVLACLFITFRQIARFTAIHGGEKSVVDTKAAFPIIDIIRQLATFIDVTFAISLPNVQGLQRVGRNDLDANRTATLATCA